MSDRSFKIENNKDHLRFKAAANSSMMKAIIISKPGTTGVGFTVFEFIVDALAFFDVFSVLLFISLLNPRLEDVGLGLLVSRKVMLGLFESIFDHFSPLMTISVKFAMAGGN